jgi:hypothetical protein
VLREQPTQAKSTIEVVVRHAGRGRDRGGIQHGTPDRNVVDEIDAARRRHAVASAEDLRNALSVDRPWRAAHA